MDLEAIKEYLEERTGYKFTFTLEQVRKSSKMDLTDELSTIIYLNDMYCNKFDAFDKAMCKNAFKEVLSLIEKDLI